MHRLRIPGAPKGNDLLGRDGLSGGNVRLTDLQVLMIEEPSTGRAMRPAIAPATCQLVLHAASRASLGFREQALYTGLIQGDAMPANPPRPIDKAGTLRSTAARLLP